MRNVILTLIIASCFWQSHAIAQTAARYQPVNPQAYYEHHQRLQQQRYVAPQGQSVYVPPRPTYSAPQPTPTYVAPPQTNAPQWHQRATQHQVPQVGVRTAPPRHALRPNAQTPAVTAQQKQAGSYITPWTPASSIKPVTNDLNLGLSVGYRVDDLDWTIAGNLAGTSPNILSELQWTDVQMIELRGEADYLINRSGLRGVYLEGGFSLAKAVSGDNQDSDFDNDNRADEFSRSNNDAGESSATSFNVGLGYQFDLVKNPQTRFFITPLIGYESNIIDLSITDGVQTVESFETVAPFNPRTPPLGPFAGLDSRYETELSGAYLGLKIGSRFGRHRLNLRGDYHPDTDYYAEAEWNLRVIPGEPENSFRQPLSFIHEGDAEGFSLKADYGFSLRPNLEIFLSGWTKTFLMEDGLDTTFFGDGAIGRTKVNEANWTSSSVHGGVKWRF